MKKLRDLLFAISLLTATSAIINTTNAATRPPELGKKEMVVTAQYLASDIGEQMLAKGGNAIDAAVAIGYALAVVHPCCGNIGGGGFMLIRFHDGRTTFINFREKAPLAFKQSLFDQQAHIKYPYLQVGVPGTVMGLNTALEKYGKLPLKMVIAPAINLAKKGYTVTHQGEEIFQLNRNKFKNQMNVDAIFTRNNELVKAGELLQQSALSRTLTDIAEGGTHEFYHGKIADKIANANTSHHGIMSKVDLASYNITEMQPITCDYRGYHIITSPPPSSGGVTICEVLNILEGYPISKMGYRSAQASHLTIEAMRLAFADRNEFLGDPDFVNNPTDKLLSKQHAQMLRQKILPNKVIDSKKIGFLTNDSKGQHTTGYVVVDDQGNAVAVTYTLNSFFGAGIIAEDTGFFLNDELDDFNLQPGKPNKFGLIQGDANKGAPGKRPLSSMAPTIITKDGKLFMVLSTPGGSTIPTQLINIIMNVIDFGMNIQEAVDAPRLHMQWLPDVTFIEPRTFSIDTLRILEKMGHKFKTGSPWGTKYWGAAAAIEIVNNGALNGAMDARRPAGSAKGY